MKIEFVADENPLYVLPFFEEFLKRYSSEFDVAEISLCRPMGKRPRRRLLMQLGTLYGPVGLMWIALRLFRAKMLGMLPKRRSARKFYTLAQLCKAYRIAVCPIMDPNEPSFVSSLVARKPDLLISVACPYILRTPILRAPPLGCINIHNAMLPNYRGMMPTFWQMYHGEPTVGGTIHYMDEKIDEGTALLQERMPVHEGESLDHLICRSKIEAAHHLARVLREIGSHSTQSFTLDYAKGSYFTFPTVEDCREFRRRGCRAI